MGMFRRRVNWTMCLFLVASLWACGTASQPFQYETDPAHRALVNQTAPAYPATRFIVLSDPHLYDTTLGTEGRAFEEYLAGDRKLLKESPEILDVAVRAIIHEAPDFVLVPGDLSKDGEASSHHLMAQYLSRIEASGTPVYITPGNHDIRNGESVRYHGDTTERVDNVSAATFAQIYGAFGYAEALHRDAASLSYVAEPKPGLWLLALDACRYKENQEGQPPITDGKFSAATLTWIEDMLAEAANTHKAVIVMMHHGVMEHFQGQEKYYGEYIVDDYARIARLFAMYHVRMVFTGHYHAQDITLERWTAPERFLYDIETGSLVTYPNPYRVISIDASQRATIQSRSVTAIASHPADFPAYSRAFALDKTTGLAAKTIEDYGVGQDEAQRLGKQVADALVAHLAGDEQLPGGQEPIQTHGLSLRAWLVVMNRKDFVAALWHDLAPPDNNLTINLARGEWN